MSRRYTGWPVRARPQGLVDDVEVHRTGQGIGDHQRRRRQVVHPHVGVYPALEIAVARQDRDDGEAALGHGLGDTGQQRPAVADTGGATEADQGEPQLVEVRGQAGALVVVHDHLRPGGERRLDPRLDRKPALDGVLGQEAGGDHDFGVGRVGAAGDGGDDHVAVADVEAGVGARRLPPEPAPAPARDRPPRPPAVARGPWPGTRRRPPWPGAAAPGPGAGPGRPGSAPRVERSSSTRSENTGSADGSSHRPWSLA